MVTRDADRGTAFGVANEREGDYSGLRKNSASPLHAQSSDTTSVLRCPAVVVCLFAGAVKVLAPTSLHGTRV